MEQREKDPSHKELLSRLNSIEFQMVETKKSIKKIQKFMYWRLVLVLAAILLPTIAIPIFLKIFLNSYLPTYIENLKALI